MNHSHNKLLKEKVLKALDKISPYLRTDGGDVELVEISEDKVVKVKLSGACFECPYLNQTLAAIKEVILKEAPEINQVISVDHRQQ